MRDVTETVARAIWRASALNLFGERDLDAEFDAFSEYDKSDRRATAIKLMSELAAAGFVIVPRKPTPEMLAAAWTAFRAGRAGQLMGPCPGFVEAMRAMLGAAPKIGGDDDRR